MTGHNVRMTNRRKLLLIAGAAIGATQSSAARKVTVAAHPWVYAATRPGYDVYPILDQIFADMNYAGIEAIELMHTSLKPEGAVNRIRELSRRHQLPVIGMAYSANMWVCEEHAGIVEESKLLIGRLAEVGGRTLGISVGDARRLGRFQATLDQGGNLMAVDFGAIIVATGGMPYQPSEYFHGDHPDVVTQLELEKQLLTGTRPAPQAAVMIQCVGSRNDEFPLCSRICCAAAVKNGIRILQANPAASVTVLYRDVRTFGFKEEYYRQARDLGMAFVKFDPELPPDVSLENGKLTVRVFEPASQMNLRIRPELLVALYHLAAMVDDHLMRITHVIRGEEWLPTLPLHAHIIRAFGWRDPEFVHLSVFLKPSGKGKMSKRDGAALARDAYSVFVKDLQDLGYTPEGVVNWIALMGWSLDDRTEVFTLADLVKSFSLERLNPSPAAINFSKLDHFNGLHIRALPEAELARRIRPFLEKAGLAVD